MNKFRKIADRYIFNRIVFKIFMIISVMVTAVPYLHNTLGSYVKFFLLYGFVILGYEIITKKFWGALKIRTNLFLMGFCISYALTLIINHDSNFFSGVKSLSYVVVFFALFYMFPIEKDKESIIKEMQIIAAVVVVCTFILSLISFSTYVFSISGHYFNEKGVYVYYGMFENRLWGLYNPNTGSTLNCISILLSVAFILSAKKKRNIVLNSINIFIQFSCLILTSSRASYNILIILLVVLAVFTAVKKVRTFNVKTCALVGLCVAVMIGAYFVIGSTLKEGLSYVPSIVRVTTHSMTANKNDAEEPPVIEQEDLTRLEETENREGGLFNGRLEIWQACLKAFKEAPIFGVGKENLVDRSIDYFKSETWKEHFKNGGAHNIYICILASAGVIGFLLLGAFAVITLGKTFLVIIKKYKNVRYWYFISFILCIMFYVNEFVEARILFQVSTFSVIFWIFLGYMYSLTKVEEKNREESDDGKLVI